MNHTPPHSFRNPATAVSETAPRSYGELINLAVYSWDRARFGGTWEDVAAFCAAHDCAGVELYTGYEPMPEDLPPGLAHAVHLPFNSTWPEMMAAVREDERTARTTGPDNAHDPNTPDDAAAPDPHSHAFFPHTNHASFLSALRLQLERAAEAGAAYAVYHVGYYQPVEMFVSIGPGERRTQTVELVSEQLNQIAGPDDPNQDPPLPPPPIDPPPQIAGGTFTLQVSSTPAGAMVTTREPGQPTSVPVGTTPVTVSLPDDRATEVAINLAGYREHKRLVVAPPNGGEVNLDVALTRKQGGGGQGGGPGPLIQDPPLPPPIVDTGAHGYLSVNTNPWTVVHVDGKSVGNTPVVRLRVAAGRHTVLMENRDLGHRRKKTVNVRRDEHVRIVERLD